MDIRNTPSNPRPSGHNLADFTRPNRDSIERGTPDVEDIRAQAARARTQQIARQEAADEKQKMERIDAARDKHSDRVASARRNEARKSGGDVVDIDPALADARGDELERIGDQTRVAARAQAARDKLAEEARRAFQASNALSDRAQAARDQLAHSDTDVRLRADARPADEASRAERVAELKAHYQQGRLNTDELVARAAYNLMSGE